MTLRRKLTAAMLCLCAALALTPAAAFAATGNIVYVGGVELEGSADQPAYAVTTEDGTVQREGADEDNFNIKWDGSTLTLDSAKVTQGSYAVEDANRGSIRAAIYCPTDFAIKLAGDNAVAGPDSDSASSAEAHTSAGIYADGSLTVSGAGSLKAVGGAVKAEGHAYGYGIAAQKNLSVSDGLVEAEGGTASATGSLGVARSCGINADFGTFEMISGTVKASANDATGVFSNSYGVNAYKVAVRSGAVEAAGDTATSTTEDREFGYAHSVGIGVVPSDGTCAITGGKVTATSYWASGAADSYAYGLESHGDTRIESATVRARGGEANYSAGMLANGDSCTIKDSTVEAIGGRASDSGLSAGIWAEYGDLTIDGGKVDATVGVSEGEAAYGIYTYFGNIAIKDCAVEAAGGADELADGVEPGYAGGICSEAGDITITGDETIVNATSGFAHDGVVGIAANGGDIVIKGGTVQADGASCHPWSTDPEDGFTGYGLSALQYDDGTGGNIVVSGGNVAAAGFTNSLSYEGELIARPADGTIEASVLEEPIVDEETYGLNWTAMAESALEIQGSPFTEETVIENTLTEGKRYFHAVGLEADPVDPVDPVDPEDPEDPTDPTEPADPAEPTDPTNPEDPADPENPTDPDKQTGDTNKSSTVPQTGDDANPTIWLVLLLTSATAMTVAAICGHRKNSKR